MDETFPDISTELIGKIFQDRFQVVRPVGAGGMGTVFLGKQLSIDRDVAIKVLREGLPDNARSRFLREARTISGLSHPGIVQMIEFGEEDGLCFLVLEFVEGRPLQDFLVRGRFHPALAITLVEQISSALAEAHAHGIIHRDLKPPNIILTVNAAGEPQAKLLDFGIAYSETDARLTQNGTLCGTPAYMAPEQAQAKEVTAQTDYYALGVNLYEMLSGRLPFYSDSPLGILLKHLQVKPPTLRAHVETGVLPAAAVDLTERLLKKERQNRPATQKELRELIAVAKREIGGAPISLEGDLEEAISYYLLPALTENPHNDASVSSVVFGDLPSKQQTPTLDGQPVDPEAGISTNRLDAVGDTMPPPTSGGAPASSRDDAGARSWAAFEEAADEPSPRQPALIDPNLWAGASNDDMTAFSGNSLEFQVPAEVFVIEPHDSTKERDRLDFDNGIPEAKRAAGKVSRDEKRADWLESASESMEYQLEKASRPKPEPPPEPDPLPELPVEQTGSGKAMSNILFILLIVGLVAGMAFIGMELFVKPAPKTPDEPSETVDYSGVLREDSDDGAADRHAPTQIRRKDDPDRRIRTPEEQKKREREKQKRDAMKKRLKSLDDVRYKKPIDIWTDDDVQKGINEVQDL